jgi:hypothetical protein
LRKVGDICMHAYMFDLFGSFFFVHNLPSMIIIIIGCSLLVAICVLLLEIFCLRSVNQFRKSPLNEIFGVKLLNAKHTVKYLVNSSFVTTLSMCESGFKLSPVPFNLFNTTTIGQFFLEKKNKLFCQSNVVRRRR